MILTRRQPSPSPHSNSSVHVTALGSIYEYQQEYFTVPIPFSRIALNRTATVVSS